MALAGRPGIQGLPGAPGASFRGSTMVKLKSSGKKVTKTVEPVIRSSFPESFIFLDFPE